MSAASPIRRNVPRFGSGDRLVPHARLAGPMPWVIAIMIALTVIAAGAGLALRNLSDNARAEIAGLSLGATAILLLGRQFAGLGSGMVAGGGLGTVDWGLLVAIPVTGVVLAVLTARMTVLFALRRML